MAMSANPLFSPGQWTQDTIPGAYQGPLRGVLNPTP